MTSKKYSSLLWELSSGDAGESSYLFGTIHLPENTLQFRVPDAMEKLMQCDVFMAEYPLDEQEDGAESVYGMDEGLDSLLPARKYDRLRRQLIKSFGLDISRFNRLKPLILEQLIAETLVREHTGLPMDVRLWEFARENDRMVRGAESLESQLRILQEFPVGLQVKNLLGIGRNPGKYRAQVRRLMTFYLEEDLVSLYKSSIRSLGAMKHSLVFERNRKIARSIGQGMQDDTVFCAVGAGHLYGKYGILRLLKQRGIRCRPIRYNRN
jgi:uncharacterized protein YbaP (TraB family)